MPSSTRFAYYAQCRLLGCAGTPRWTKASTLEALRYFLHDEARLPVSQDCRAQNGMPSAETILRLWGTMAAWRDAFEQGCRAVPAPMTPVTPGLVRCLRCDGLWQSPDTRQCRICPPCTSDPFWEEGAWLPALVIQNGTYSLEALPESEEP